MSLPINPEIKKLLQGYNSTPRNAKIYSIYLLYPFKQLGEKQTQILYKMSTFII